MQQIYLEAYSVERNYFQQRVIIVDKG